VLLKNAILKNYYPLKKNKYYTALILVFITIASIAQPYQGVSLSKGSEANFRIYPSNISQSEVFITSSPLDQNVLFSSCNTLSFIPFFVSEGIYVSENGGFDWIGNDTCTGEPIQFHGGDPGIAIDKNGTFIITRLGIAPFTGLYSHYSNDNGQTWTGQQVISTDDLERATVATDIALSSSHYGRTYAAWVKFASPFPIMYSYTDNGGQSWSTPYQINNPSHRSAGGDICVGRNGEVYACWAGVTESSPFKEILIGFASSTNGGESWNVTENAFEVNGITGILPDKANIRVNGLPGIAVDTTSSERQGWIYIVTGQKELAPAGSDPDIILYRSEDGGQSWSDGIRVNQDALSNGKTQYFPTVHIDQYSGVNVIFYDDRNTTTDSTGVFLARSENGGDSWTEYEISDHNFKPAPIGGLGQGYQGDNIDITSTDSTLWPVWMDNSTGTYQIWSGPLHFTEVNAVEEFSTGSAFFKLQQNTPNPFSIATSIVYELISSGFVTINIYDSWGNIVVNLVNEFKAPGKYEIEFDPTKTVSSNSELNNGLFFYRISVNGTHETRRMIFSK